METLLLALLGCAPSDAEGVGDSAPAPWVGPLDDVLSPLHVQSKGTHNSYHQAPDPVLDPSHAYDQPSLTEQLDRHHVRQLELDLHRTESGAWQVFHLPAIDPETSCLALVDCLGEVAAWSAAHPWHLPITIWLEPKDDLDSVVEGLQPIDREALLGLDAVLREALGAERLFAPDALRGPHATLPEALAADGWPTLATMRGRVLVALLDSGTHRDAYLEGAPALEGRAMFVDRAADDAPHAALLKDGGPDEVAAAVAAGLLVTVNGSAADDAPDAAATTDAAQLAAGAHHVATDRPDADGVPYGFELVPRCHPVTAPPDCTPEALEPL